MPGMRGSEFEQYFEKIPIVHKQFLKVTSVDEIPSQIKLKHFLISNLSPSSEPGTHWIAIVRSEDDTLEIFNSLGVNSLDTLKPHLNFRQKLNVVFNEQAFQSKESTSCGYFCIYFIIHRILNFDMSFEHLLEDIFTSNCALNENIVETFSNKLLNDHPDLFED